MEDDNTRNIEKITGEVIVRPDPSMFDVPPERRAAGRDGNVKKGWSWGSIIREVSEMYPGDLIALVGEDSTWGRILSGKPRDIQMKYLVVVAAFAALTEMPSPSLFNLLMERSDGKVPTVLKASDGSMMQITTKRVDVDTDRL